MLPEYFTNTVNFLTSVNIYGETVIDNSLTVNGKISASDIIYDKDGNSEEWNSVYSSYQSASSNNVIASEYLALSGGSMTGKLIVAADASTSRLNIGNAISLPEPSSLINGDIWLTSGHRIGWRSGGVTYSSAITNLSNTFNQPQIITSTSNVFPALRITQTGKSNALVIEDSTNPDSTPFVVDDLGSVGIGLSSLSGIDAKLTVVGNISSTGVVYASGGNSNIWNSVYTTYNQNSATYATQNYVQNNFLALTGGTVTGDTQFNKNVTIWGVLSATGGTYFANTIYSTTSALSVIHVGSGTALYVGSTGTGDIASFYDLDGNVEMLHIGGHDGDYPNVGIKTSTPNVDFTVNGEISSSEIIYDANGNSNQWNSAYLEQTNFLPLSGGTMNGRLKAEANKELAKLNIGNAITSLSSNPWGIINGDVWINNGNRLAYKSNSSVYTLAITNTPNAFTSSQTIDISSNTFPAFRVTQRGTSEALRVEDETTPDTTAFIVGSNGSVSIGLSSLNGIDSKLTVVGNISATEVIYANNGNSDLWNSVYTSITSISANWNSVYTSVKDTSANWNSVYTSVNPVSSNWDSVYTSVNPVSSNWNSVYTSVKDTSANWDSVYTTYNKNSATYATIEFANNKFLPLSGGIITGDLTVNNILQIGDGNPIFDFIITEEGNVGINTETPNEKLTVVGNISCTGFLYGNGSNLTGIVAGDTVATTLVRTNSANWDSVYSSVNAGSANWDSVYSNVLNTSANWDSVYTTYNTNSAKYSTIEFVDNKFLPLSGGTITGKLTLLPSTMSVAPLKIPHSSNDPSSITTILSAAGDIWLNGGIRYRDQVGTIRYVADINRPNVFTQNQIIWAQASTTNAGLRITQEGPGNAILVEDSSNPDSTPFVVDTNGSVGIGLSSLSGVNAKLTIIGNVSSTGTLYASGGNSDLWNSAYSNFSNNSSNYIKQNGNSFNTRAIVGTIDNNDFSINTNNTEKMRIFSNGNVAYDDFSNLPGAAGNSTYKVMHYASPTNAGSTMLSMASKFSHTVFFGNLGGSTGGFVIGSEGTNKSISFKQGLTYSDSNTLGTGTTVMSIAGNGNVGIGNTSPNEKLTVVGNISATQNYFSGSNKSVFTPQTNTVGVSAISNIVAVSVLPATPDPSTLYIVI